MSERRKSFSSEFKDEAVKMVIESSRAVADVARELGIGAETLRTWVNRYRVEHADEEPPLTISERARLRELEKENRELNQERIMQDLRTDIAPDHQEEHEQPEQSLSGLDFQKVQTAPKQKNRGDADAPLADDLEE